jgi:hypothetical protein
LGFSLRFFKDGFLLAFAVRGRKRSDDGFLSVLASAAKESSPTKLLERSSRVYFSSMIYASSFSSKNG